MGIALAKLAEVQETERMKQQAEEYMGLEGYACGGKMGRKYARGSNMKYDGIHADDGIAFIPPTEQELQNIEEAQFGKPGTSPLTEEVRQKIAMDGYTPEIKHDDARMIGLATDYISGGVDGNYNPYPTWMRYAPAVGAGIMSLTDMLGLTNKPDYTYADKLEAAANRAGYAPNIQYQPIGDYLRYRPMDIWYQQNALNAQARATDRALTNSSSPSKAAGLLASGYNSQLASGNLYRQALEYNDAKRQQVADFNRKTNMFNSQMDLEAAMANARYAQQARQMGLSGLAQAAALRDAIDQRVGAARSANLNNFLTSLGNIGRENFALNQINDDDAYAYGATTRGTTPHKRRVRGKKNSRWT